MGGASELRFKGASEKVLAGASERRLMGASEKRLRKGASELRLGGASETRLGGASEERLVPSVSNFPPVPSRKGLIDGSRLFLSGPPRSPAVRAAPGGPDGHGGTLVV